ncbi:hypothetical protein Nepgr_018134 [Nepenthes gracilis]|uniref:Protein kinase domain-containing protein n=1 Tax=Nepenthes gracilis TaxID=150966 RepID=A0AAD3SQQ4_NEPGR|nr:hypothetical protein Nepgr_018134 [Nepenthes gracilis]
MIQSRKKMPHFLGEITVFVHLFIQALSLNSDGTLLLAFKYSVLSDPLSVLDSWHYYDQTPCSWTGVTCADMGNPGTPESFRVISLVLTSSQLMGSISPDLGFVEHLQHLDLSNNYFNGTFPSSLFNASELEVLSLANNVISGELPEYITQLKNLSYLNLSDNALVGVLPHNLSTSQNLTVVSLKGNNFSGSVPSGFSSIEILDLSTNLFNGSLPSDLGGLGLRYLNLSNNMLTGDIPPGFASQSLENSTIDLSFNNLTGQIPASSKALQSQKSQAFAGNPDLCGNPLKKLCVIPSSLSTPPNVSASISPAIAVIPKTVGPEPMSNTSSSLDSSHGSGGLKPATIVGITLADLAGISLLGIGFLYFYQLKKIKSEKLKATTETYPPAKEEFNGATKDHEFSVHIASNATAKSPTTAACCCLKATDHDATRTSSSSESEDNNDKKKQSSKYDGVHKGLKEKENEKGGGGGGSLVMVDGETELEVETLLKASAYIMGASGSSIVYKVVLQDGTTYAVRRLGDSGVQRMRDFENQVKIVARLRHPNLVRVRGFYWGSDEKLIISDYVSNGCLASSGFRKIGSSPAHLPLEIRLKIARGVARCLTYVHEKKFVHGNLKPSNILLTPDMEPIVTDLGLSWLLHGDNSCKWGGSGRQFGSKRATPSNEASQEMSAEGSPYIYPFGSASGPASPYQAPESLKSLKPNPKWDVYSFGIVLLELLTGSLKVAMDRELAQWTPGAGLEDRYWALRMADVAIRAEVQGREEDMMGIFKVGISCASLLPQRRPTMKEALQVLEKSPLA